MNRSFFPIFYFQTYTCNTPVTYKSDHLIMSKQVLIPLESNPEVMNKLLQKLGVSNKWNIVDVIGLEPETLAWVPRPVAALILLFPHSDAYEQHKQQEESEILSKGQKVTPEIFYMKQNVSNACGTIALLHSIANNTDKIELTDVGYMKQFLKKANGLDAAARGTLLEQTEGIINAHRELAQEGQTNTPGAEDPVSHHFITFVHKDGTLYELDGSKAFPVNHGPTTPDNFLEDAAKVCQGFMARDPNEVRFTVVALVAND